MNPTDVSYEMREVENGRNKVGIPCEAAWESFLEPLNWEHKNRCIAYPDIVPHFKRKSRTSCCLEYSSGIFKFEKSMTMLLSPPSFKHSMDRVEDTSKNYFYHGRTQSTLSRMTPLMNGVEEDIDTPPRPSRGWKKMTTAGEPLFASRNLWIQTLLNIRHNKY